MNKFVEKVQPFIEGSPVIKIVEDESFNEIVNVESGDVLGYVHFEDGRFKGFERIEADDEEEKQFVNPPNKNKMLETAQLFADTFIERDVHLSMLNEWSENHFMVTYEERDPTLGLQLPHTGFTLNFTSDGILTSAHIGQTEFRLEYPDIKISSEEAKRTLRKANYVELGLHIPFLDEDESRPELIYRPSHDIMSIGVDGRIERAAEFLGTEELSTENIPLVQPTSSLEEMLGVNDDLEKRADEEDSVIWIDPAADTTENEEAEALISITSNETGHFSFSNVTFEKQKDALPLSMEMLNKRALEILELAEGTIHEKFVLEKPIKVELIEEEECFGEESPDEMQDDDAIFPEPEPTQMFSFYRVHHGFRLEGMEAYVHVGLYTGLIRECSVTCLNPEQAAKLEKLDMKPLITLQEAEDRIFDEMEMGLARCVKNFDDAEVFTLCYLVDFPGEKGHIEKVNAHTGEVSYVETGIIKESN